MRYLTLLLLLFFGDAVALAQREAVPQAQVYGAVRDAGTGATVYCTVEQYDMAGKRQALTTVNSDGRYSFFVPAGQPFLLRIADENGYAVLERSVKAIPANAAPQRIDLLLEPE